MSFDIEIRYTEERDGIQGRTTIRSWFNAFLDALTRQDPAMREIGEAMVLSTKRRFNIEMSPSDGRWARNSPVTIEQKGHSKPLKGKTDALRQSIRYTLLGSGKAVTVGSDLPYAAMQQFGGTKERFPHLWGDIPARPFLGRSDADQRTIRKIMRRHMGLPAE